jgi:hypothetical protein
VHGAEERVHHLRAARALLELQEAVVDDREVVSTLGQKEVGVAGGVHKSDAWYVVRDWPRDASTLGGWPERRVHALRTT